MPHQTALDLSLVMIRYIHFQSYSVQSEIQQVVPLNGHNDQQSCR